MNVAGWTALLAATVLVACASPRDVAKQVVESNIGQEQAHNQLMLLNVVRAHKRMPMHFSRMTAARLPLGIGNPTFTVPTPWGPDYVQQIYNISTQVAISQSVDTQPLDSQEFMRGITTPVSASVMVYYLDQGWPQQMILHLFVRSIEVLDAKGQLVRRYENYPGNEDRFDAFQRKLAALTGCEIDLASEATPDAFGPSFAASAAASGQVLAAAKTAGLKPYPVGADGKPTEQVSTQWGYFTETSGTRLKFTKAAPDGTCDLPDGATEATSKSAAGVQRAVMGKVTASFVLRSPEAMLYYLGELARAGFEQLDQNSDIHPPAVASIPLGRARAARTSKAALFRMSRLPFHDTGLSVEHEGVRYYLPASSASDRSMHTLSLIHQLMLLHNKGTESPATLNVRAIQ